MTQRERAEVDHGDNRGRQSGQSCKRRDESRDSEAVACPRSPELFITSDVVEVWSKLEIRGAELSETIMKVMVMIHRKCLSA